MFTAAKKRFTGEAEVPTSAPAAKNGLLDGLPGRSEAQAVLAAALTEGRPMFAAVFVVDRVNVVNDCFGYALGDKLLLSFHDHLRDKLLPTDRVCRWTGTSFLALLEREGSLESVDDEIRQLAAEQPEIAVHLGSGALVLSAAANWAVFPLRGVRSADSLPDSIDFYITRNLGRQVQFSRRPE